MAQHQWLTITINIDIQPAVYYINRYSLHRGKVLMLYKCIMFLIAEDKRLSIMFRQKWDGLFYMNVYPNEPVIWLIADNTLHNRHLYLNTDMLSYPIVCGIDIVHHKQKCVSNTLTVYLTLILDSTCLLLWITNLSYEEECDVVLATHMYYIINSVERLRMQEIYAKIFRYVHFIWPHITDQQCKSIRTFSMHFISICSVYVNLKNTSLYCRSSCLDISMSLRWRHIEPDGVSNHQPYDCLLKRLFRRRLKEIPKLRVTGLCAENAPVTDEFPAQRASNAEYFSIWWRHHGQLLLNIEWVTIWLFGLVFPWPYIHIGYGFIWRGRVKRLGQSLNTPVLLK